MADKKKLIEDSSAGNLRPDGTDKRWEYPEIDMEKAAKNLEQLEKGDSKFRDFMEKGRKAARKLMNGVKMLLIFLFVMVGSRRT